MERKKVLITMEPDTLAELDRLRGKEPRARVIETACIRWIEEQWREEEGDTT